MNYHRFTKSIRDDLDTLAVPNNYRGLLGLAYDYAVIAVAIYVTLQAWWFYPAALLLIGARQRAFVTILHDAGHQTLCANKTLNDFVARFFVGYPLVQGFKTYITSHVINHHNHIGDDDRDPDLQYYVERGLFEETDRKRFVREHLIKPLFFGFTLIYIRMLLVHRWKQLREGSVETIVITVYWAVIIAICAWFGWLPHLLLFWFVPLVLMFPWIGWFAGIAEHYPLIRNKDEIHMSWNRFSHPVEAFFTALHNENFHLTHHLRPDIPYWNLKKAHEVMLRDPVYAEANEEMGGIFFSSNGKPSFWQRTLRSFDRPVEATRV